MPAITIVTNEQRAAVMAAARAARIVRARIAEAALLELARDDSPVDGDTKYQLFTVWGAGESDGHTGVKNRPLLWSAAPDHDSHHRLAADEVRQVQLLLRTVVAIEPFLFEPGELASNAWVDIDAVLAAHQG